MKVKSVKFNFIMNLILTLSSLIFPLITFPYISRVLSVEGVGKIAFATSFISYFQMIAFFGLPIYGVKACAEVRENKEELTRVTHELFIIGAVMTSLSYLVLILSVLFVPTLQDRQMLIAISSLSIVFSAFGMGWFYGGIEEYKYVTIRSLVVKIIGIILMILFVKTPTDYYKYAVILVLNTALSDAYNCIHMRKYISFHFVGNYKFKRHIKPLITLFMTSSAISVYTNLDVVMLGIIKGDVEVGLYNTAIKVKVILQSVVGCLGAVVLPRLSHYYDKGAFEEFYRLVKKALNFMVVFSVPVAVYFVLEAENTILLLAGDEFLGAVTSMKIIIPIIILNGISGITGIQVMVPLKKEKQLFWSVLFGAIVNFSLNLFLINWYGVIGASIATVIAELCVTLFQIICLRKELKGVIKELSVIKAGIAVVVATTLNGLISAALDFSVFLSFVTTAFLFFVCYGVVLIILKEKFVHEMVLPIIRKGIKRNG